MLVNRVVLLSKPQAEAAPNDVLAACRDFPSRNAQSGICGRLLCAGDQMTFLLEGPWSATRALIARLKAEVPEAGFGLRFSETVDSRAFSSWAIADLYIDEIKRADAEAAELLGDRLIDLFVDAGDEDGAADPFAEVAQIVEQHDRVTGRRAAA